jgi:hypothetical protein
MSLHNDFLQDVRRIVCSAQDNQAEFISPSAVAVAVYGLYQRDSDDPHVAFGAIEFVKHIARGELANKLNVDSENNAAMQDDMFSGLQDHYPVKVGKGEEPRYVRRDLLALEQLDFNISRLLKFMMACGKHADALQAYRDQRANDLLKVA